MNDLAAVGYCLLAAVLFVTFVFGVAYFKNRYDLIDPAWGLVFISIAVVAFSGQAVIAALSVQSLVLLLVITWGIRLYWHLSARWEHNKIEDRRYSDLRAKYEKSFGGLAVNMYVRVYLVQAILAMVISLPVILLNTVDVQQISWISIVGLLVWMIGFYFEAIGDAQLAAFVKNNKKKGALMTKGLWKYTRHPNYFGEVTQWWGIFIIIAPLLSNWWIAIIGPIVISVLIILITGVPLTEKHFAGRPGWDAYKRRTSKFLPLPPKKV